MKLQYVIAAESMSMDNATGKVSVFHLIDNIEVVSTPFLIPNLTLVSLLKKEPSDKEHEPFDLEIVLNTTTLFTNRQHASFEGGRMNRNFINVQGMVISEIGVLSLIIKQNNKELGRWDVTIQSALSRQDGYVELNAPQGETKPKTRRQTGKKASASDVA